MPQTNQPLDIEFELEQVVQICDEEHVYYGSTGTIIRFLGSDWYVVQLSLVDEQVEVSGEQIMPWEEVEIPF